MLRILFIIIILFLTVILFFIFYPPEFKKPVLKNKIQRGSLGYKGITRNYLYYVPDDLPDNAPLILVFHRARSNSSDLRKMLNYRYDELADKHKFLVLYPDGHEKNWNDCRTKPSDSAHKLNIDDTGYISALIDLFKKNHSIDKTKVYVTGFSAGGHMCIKLAAEIPDAISKMALAATQIPSAENYGCRQLSRPIPILIINGDEDPISPYNGGEISILKFIKQGKVIPVDKTVSFFLKLNNLKNEPSVSTYPYHFDENQPWIEKKIWLENNKYPLHQYIVHHGGHTMPGAKPLPSLIFGKTFKDYLIADDIVHFFLN